MATVTWDRRAFLGHLLGLQSVDAVRVGCALLNELWMTGVGPVARDELCRGANLDKRSFDRGLKSLVGMRIVRVASGRQGGEPAVYELAGRWPGRWRSPSAQEEPVLSHPNAA
jgi:hypothetical protein